MDKSTPVGSCSSEENVFSQARQGSGTRRLAPTPLSFVSTERLGATVGLTNAQHPGDTTLPEEPSSPSFNRAIEYLRQLFNRDKTPELDSFEIIDKANVERECPLVEWSRQEPEKDRITIQPCRWKYRIYLPSKVLRDLRQQHAEERAAFISVQIKDHLDFFIAIIPPGQTRSCLATLSKYAIPEIKRYAIRHWDRMVMLDGDNGVVLSACWALPLAYDIQTWTETSPKLNEGRGTNPRIRARVRSTSVDDMVMVG
ncbi:hypothetical protein FRC07_011990 [Ceratobasidium sp. 392]|nr:hypothetical protein FRC07_011990 [Ceratobasidium sp. 392]